VATLCQKNKRHHRDRAQTKELQNLHMEIDHGRERERFALYMKFWSIVNRRTTPIPPPHWKACQFTDPSWVFLLTLSSQNFGQNFPTKLA